MGDVDEIVKLINLSFLPSISNGDSRTCEKSDFIEFRSLQITRLATLEIAAEGVCLQMPIKDLKTVLTLMYILFGENHKESPWNDDDIVSSCNKIKKKILTQLNCSEKNILDSGLQVKEGIEIRSIMKDILLALRPKLMKETWKQYPASVFCFNWLLDTVSPISLNGHVSNILPTALLLVDDYFSINKSIGAQCLARILSCMTTAELKFHGFGQLIFKTLERLLRDREPLVADAVIPCILYLNYKLDANFGEVPTPHQWSQIDDVLEILLEMIQVEHFIELRKIYIFYLPGIVNILGNKIYRWMKRLILILDDYLEVGGNHKDYDNMLHALEALGIVLTKSESVQKEYKDVVSFILLRTLYQLINIELVEKAKRVIEKLILLLRQLHKNSSEEEKNDFKKNVFGEVNLCFPETKFAKILKATLTKI